MPIERVGPPEGIRPISGDLERGGEARRFLAELQHGQTVRGQVLSESGEGYLVRIGDKTLLAQSTVPLRVGQAFSAVLDKSGPIPLLRLMGGGMEAMASFSGVEREVALALMEMGLPVMPGTVRALAERLRGRGLPGASRALVELWVRGLPFTEENLRAMALFSSLSREEASYLWSSVRRKLRRALSEEDLRDGKPLEELLDLDEDEKLYLLGQKLSLIPPRGDLSRHVPTRLDLPVGEESSVCRVLLRYRRGEEGLEFLKADFEGDFPGFGPLKGEVVLSGSKAVVTLEVDSEEKGAFLEAKADGLKESLSALGLILVALKAGPTLGRGGEGPLPLGLDVLA